MSSAYIVSGLIAGPLDHDGATIGFFTQPPTTQQSAPPQVAPSDHTGIDTINQTMVSLDIAALATAINDVRTTLIAYGLVV